ncbi:hypothetical protein HK100_012434 [Physocladia obscura]|uniref:HECT-type E3 ubiquitin transferase n=1 Tax=Physocladia obscura TaxID=109957 RepID=A0AAD5T1H7_9FUNG|nr:hypothetical protein HK100_012434 [Physocladia obscura]
MLDVPGEFHNKLVETLSFFWSRQFIQAAFSPVLSYLFPPPSSIFLKTSKLPNVFAKLGFRTPESSNNNQFQFSSKLEESQTTTISISILSACNLFHQLTRTLRNSKTHILTSLSWTPTLIPRLWRLLNIVGPNQAGTKLFLTPAAARAPHREPFALVLQLFCESCCILFMTLDDVDIYERQYPFVIEELAALSSFLNQFCFNAVWNAANPSGTFVLSSFVPVDGGINDAGGAVVEAAQKLLGILYDQSSRRPLGNSSGFSADGERVDDWIVRTVSGRDIVADIKNGDQRTIAVLNSMPQCIPFAQRVEVFRYMVKADKLTIGEAPMDIIVRRRSVLEDGLKQLGKISPSQLKQTIKVRFMNELGLYEAGIDQNGVFKEFLEDICKSAFATDFGLFRTTDDGNCVPSISSGIHENHLTLLEFVGKIFSKALYEGIVIDIPFATFVYAKMLGRLNFFEDLPSLDAELYKNLVFLKHYEGDVSDLGLTFTIDENIFGAIKSKEIKPGGAAIEVNNENKFEYIHIMSDYKLNQECKAQFKALVGGFRSIMPEKYIRFFSPQELQTLMSGENVDFDIADLRKYTRYEAGYFDQHATIRLFWQVVTELSPKEKNAFLKFVTSCSNPPVGGFKHLEPPFTIRFVAAIASDDADANPASQFGKALGSFFGVGKDATRLPTASTCFNVLKELDLSCREFPMFSIQTLLKQSQVPVLPQLQTLPAESGTPLNSNANANSYSPSPSPAPASAAASAAAAAAATASNSALNLLFLKTAASIKEATANAVAAVSQSSQSLAQTSSATVAPTAAQKPPPPFRIESVEFYGTVRSSSKS